MILVKNLNFFCCFSLGKIGLAIVFGDVLDRNQAFPGYKNINLYGHQIGFSKGLVHEFGQNCEISSLLAFGQNRPRNCVWRCFG